MGVRECPKRDSRLLFCQLSSILPGSIRQKDMKKSAWTTISNSNHRSLPNGHMIRSCHQDRLSALLLLIITRPPAENIQQFSLSPESYEYDPNITMDMGNSLNYSQTMEFRSNSMPQPTTSIPRIRERRFKELREKRTRNKPERGYPNVEALQQRKASGLLASDSTLLPGKTVIGSFFRRGRSDNRGMAPGPSGGLINGASTNGTVQPYLSPAQAQASGNLAVAAAPAQDTGMIQRVQVRRAAFLITGALMLSSILGLVRTFLFPYVFSIGNSSDAYLQAYIIPNLLYTVVAGGALSSAFIPVFIKYYDGLHDEKSAWHIASSALNLSVVILIALSVLAMLFAPLLVPLYSPGFSPSELALTVTLTRIMLLQAIVLGSGVIVSSVLNAKQDFTLTALGTVLYNVGLIIGFLPGVFLYTHARNATSGNFAVYAATWGVVLAAILQMSVQIPGLFKVKMRYTFSFDWRHPGVRQIGRQMIPRTINAAMLSFSTAVDRSLLSFLGTVVSTQVFNGLITRIFSGIFYLCIACLDLWFVCFNGGFSGPVKLCRS